MLRKFLKYLASFSPTPLTKNEYYDRLTERVIKKVCAKDSVCVDVGANEGKILSMFIRHCPAAFHYAFEPIDKLYFLLVRKFGSGARVFKIAMSDKKGFSKFNYVVDDAAYSSLQQRQFNTQKIIEQVEVETDCLDNLIHSDIDIRLIKLDIEGGEYDALKGAEALLKRCKPFILFEFGKGGSDAFGVTPAMMFNFLSSHGYSINLLPQFLRDNGRPFTLAAFVEEYEKGKEYFFIGYHIDR